MSHYRNLSDVSVVPKNPPQTGWSVEGRRDVRSRSNSVLLMSLECDDSVVRFNGTLLQRFYYRRVLSNYRKRSIPKGSSYTSTVVIHYSLNESSWSFPIPPHPFSTPRRSLGGPNSRRGSVTRCTRRDPALKVRARLRTRDHSPLVLWTTV